MFLSHQVGAFTGVWLGGAVYDANGTYDVMWWLPISERRDTVLAASPA